MEEIECNINHEDLFMQLSIDKVDLKESEKRFISLVKSALLDEFPGSRIYAEIGSKNFIAVGGITCSPATSQSRTIVEKVIKDKKWAVNKSSVHMA